jgi:hypothetical protein
MYASTFALAALAAAHLAAAVGNARVINNCTNDVTLWSVDSNISDPYTLVAGGGSYAEPFRVDPKTAIALKITLGANGLYTGEPQTIFAYNLKEENTLWYDLSDVFGDAFAGSKLVEQSGDASCEAIVFDNGISPGASQVKTCTSDQDVTLTLCAA